QQMNLRQIVSLGCQYFQLDTQTLGHLPHGCVSQAPVRLGALTGVDERHAQRGRRQRHEHHQQDGNEPTDNGERQTSGSLAKSQNNSTSHPASHYFATSRSSATPL